jgi:hypothetical protein
MKTWLKAQCVLVGLWLARLGGWRPAEPPAPCALPHLPADTQVDLVRQIVQDIEQRYPSTPGPVKAREALRVLLNLRPQAREKDLNLLIELALQ